MAQTEIVRSTNPEYSSPSNDLGGQAVLDKINGLTNAIKSHLYSVSEPGFTLVRSTNPEYSDPYGDLKSKSFMLRTAKNISETDAERQARYAKEDKDLANAIVRDRLDRMRQAATLKRRQFEGTAAPSVMITKDGYPVPAGANPREGFGPYPMDSERGRTTYKDLVNRENALYGIPSPKTVPYPQTEAGFTAGLKSAENIANSRQRPGTTQKDLLDIKLRKTEAGRRLQKDASEYALKSVGGLIGPENQAQFNQAYMEYINGTLGQKKQLDENTARQFLQQAGGDKDKARELARQAGYSF